ncbi:MAG TPA: 3-hydroxyacyl-CoA dehydrogenase family protein [Gaiellales bacterium]|jgi:3-hydroxybutyryl-CoA dehydrogenase|nr:3-hydroxyacyl-CoA dehydrogenase family protein [Gaiellales bacterium]
MDVVVVGAGLMGSQIAAEYALAGHGVRCLARHPDVTRERVDTALATALRLGLRDEAATAAATARIGVAAVLAEIERCDLVVESVPEELELKGEVLSPIAAQFPDAVIASNTSSLSIEDIGEACGAPERTVGTHYWNPPLLMPLVEVIAGPQSRPEAVELARAAVASCGKRPVLVQRDVPGFIWNRLQHALLREALWIIDNGVATPEAVDEVVRFGNARRWEHVGPFAAAALGGIGTWQRVAGELFPVLSNARDAGDLERALWADKAELAEIAAARDAGLARDLRED